MSCSSLSVAVLQLRSIDDIQKNLEQILQLLSGLSPFSERGLICLPENALYMRLKEGAPVYEITLDSSPLQRLLLRAKELNATIHIGAGGVRGVRGVGNQSIILDPELGVRPGYQKIHLFDIGLIGQAPLRESDAFAPGDEPQILKIGDWSFGQTICYDLRFSELFHRYAKCGVEGLLIPSSFLKSTGEHHWHVLVRARAIENQAYVIAAAQAGLHKSERGERHTYGRSLIVDPWGKIIAEGSADEPQVLTATISLDLVKSIRSQIPMAAHRRLI